MPDDHEKKRFEFHVDEGELTTWAEVEAFVRGIKGGPGIFTVPSERPDADEMFRRLVDLVAGKHRVESVVGLGAVRWRPIPTTPPRTPPPAEE